MVAETGGVHHVGLAVADVEKTAAFFIEVLGWEETRRDQDYPAIFVSDGQVLVTLWQVANPAAALPFDRRHHIGLHHLALRVASHDKLMQLYDRLSRQPEIRIEFAPEPLRGGPVMHMMCDEPGGIRIEFIAVP